MNGLEEELEGRLRVLLVSIHTPDGRELAGQYSVGVTPTFIFLDAEGQETWRQIGTLDAERVRESAR